MIPDFRGMDGLVGRALSLAYGGLRRFDERRRALRPRIRPPIPTISIGNVTVGGTGKTPMAAYVAERMAALGHRPVILSRGYMGTAAGPEPVPPEGSPLRFGDEPVMLARRGLNVWVAKRRELGVEPACREADVLLLDDGFQRIEIERDLDLVMFGPEGLGNGRLLPAGILRDDPRNLQRADAFCGRLEDMPALFPDTPRFDFAHRGLTLLPAPPGPGTRLAALAAIGSPGRFFAALEAAGVVLHSRHALADHDPLLPARLAELERSWRSDGIEAVIATEKDAVKLPEAIGPVPVIVARSRWAPASEQEARSFDRFLKARLGA